MKTLPRITLTYAQTLDGRSATASRSSQWISGSESLRFAHQLRADHDAIMVGVGTLLADDPRLTVRLVPGRDPLRVVADSLLRAPATAAVLHHGAGRGTILAHTAAAPAHRRAELAATGATLLELPAAPGGGIDLGSLLADLAERGVGSLMVEGGARLITAMLRERLASHMAVTVAPKILGEGLSAIGDLGIARLSDAYTLADVRVTPYGVDLVIEGRVVYP